MCIRDRYKVVAAFDVLEHLQDPNGFMQTVNSVLKDDGILFFQTPDVYKRQVQRMRGRLTYTDFEALSHVSFDVRRGEVPSFIKGDSDSALAFASSSLRPSP